VAARTDERCSGGFTLEATVAAPRADTPDASVWCLRHHPHAGHPHAGGRGDVSMGYWRRNWLPASRA
jgi:hypothetical protein